MFWIAVTIYVLAAAETYMLIVTVGRLMNTDLSYPRAIALSVIWPVLPLLFFKDVVFGK